jgi:large subunit ribosomal protein L21
LHIEKSNLCRGKTTTKARILINMRTRSLLKAALDVRWTPSQLPPTFLLPWRAQLHQSTQSTQFQNTPPEIPPQNPSQPPFQPSTPPSTPSTRPPPNSSISLRTPKPLVLSKSLQQLLPLLTAQKPHFITAHIHRFPYLLTEGDTLRLPFHMHGVSPGDILRLNRASILGSRDYTLKAGTNTTESYDGKRTGEPNYIDERLFECRARVMGVDSGPMVKEIKTKRRQRRKKTVFSKHRYTVLSVMQVKVKSLEELREGREQLILQ